MIGIVIATHCKVASALRDAAQVILGEFPAVRAVTLAASLDRDTCWDTLRTAVTEVDEGHGVLVLADMFGGTPSNMAMALLAEADVDVVTGVNLPMVLRAVQRRDDLNLIELAKDILAYGQRNITCASDWLRPDSGDSP